MKQNIFLFSYPFTYDERNGAAGKTHVGIIEKLDNSPLDVELYDEAGNLVQ